MTDEGLIEKWKLDVNAPDITIVSHNAFLDALESDLRKAIDDCMSWKIHMIDGKCRVMIDFEELKNIIFGAGSVAEQRKRNLKKYGDDMSDEDVESLKKSIKQPIGKEFKVGAGSEKEGLVGRSGNASCGSDTVSATSEKPAPDKKRKGKVK